MFRKRLLGLLLMSFLITNVIAFLDEGIRTFDYLMRIGDWMALLIYTLLFLIMPLIIFFRVKDNKNRFTMALIGFLPALFLILPNL
ncbi:MAG: hypothetical protein AAFX55_12680 [Bacteroidota bacterium]